MTHQSAVAVKHIVLPTYMGSRRTLNGNLQERPWVMLGLGLAGAAPAAISKANALHVPFNAMVHQDAKVVP